MSFTGPPENAISVDEFYRTALNTADADARRRLFADARASNPGSYQVWVKSAEVEEHWGADEAKLKTQLVRGVTVFKNPVGSAQPGFAAPAPLTQEVWLSEAIKAEGNGKSKTANALRAAVDEAF